MAARPQSKEGPVVRTLTGLFFLLSLSGINAVNKPKTLTYPSLSQFSCKFHNNLSAVSSPPIIGISFRLLIRLRLRPRTACVSRMRSAEEERH